MYKCACAWLMLCAMLTKRWHKRDGHFEKWLKHVVERIRSSHGSMHAGREPPVVTEKSCKMLKGQWPQSTVAPKHVVSRSVTYMSPTGL